MSALRAVALVAALGMHLSAQPSVTPLDTALVQSTVQSLARVIEQEYFDTTAAARVAQALRATSAERRFASEVSREGLAQRLTDELYRRTLRCDLESR